MATTNYCIWGLLFLVTLSLLTKTGYSIECYQCESIDNKTPFQCNEFLTSDMDLEPKSCDNVYGAQYCVKHIGRFEAITLDCYQCTSQDEWKCGDNGLVESVLVPTNCSHVYGARFCIKSIGRYGGFYIMFRNIHCRQVCTSGIGTKRFCSAADLGNYCDYVKHVGDKLTYRTCIYTCTGDGCNSATSSMPNATYMGIISVGLLVVWKMLFHR